MKTTRLIALLALSTGVAAGAVYVGFQLATPDAPSLAQYAPAGAQLAIESPNFSALLRSWNGSPEERSWLAGDNYAAFSRSRVFGFLNKAQSAFADAAGLAADGHFLEQIAGSQSLFAWYDVRHLEFLYITRLPSGQAAKTPLYALRGKFQQRQAGGVVFYVRDSDTADAIDDAGKNNPDAAPGDASADASADSADTGKNNSGPATTRVVAFAVRGDFLLLATREDLMASALEQMARPGGRSLATDAWYASSVAAADEKPGDLRMTLNLASIAHQPYFSTYWVPQNITEMRRYSAALSDLYREHATFHEERFLIPTPTAPPTTDGDLASVLHFLPAGAVYRAVAHPSADDTLAQLQDKLLARTPANVPNPREAPTASLEVPIVGDASDLDDTIDTQAPPVDARRTALAALQSLLRLNAPDAVLSFSTAAQSASESQKRNSSNIFLTLHSGVAISTSTPCDAAAWKQALTQALSPRLSVGEAGLHWKDQSDAALHWAELDGQFPLAFAASDKTCLVASDSATLLAMLRPGTEPASTRTSASTIAGFSHSTQRAPLIALATQLDHGSRSPADADDDNSDDRQPPFFSGNMASLSNAFSDLDSETFVEFHASPTLTRQTVSYAWRTH